MSREKEKISKSPQTNDVTRNQKDIIGGKNFRKQSKNTMTGSASSQRFEKTKIAISIGISTCSVGNSTTTIKRKRNKMIMVKTPWMLECYLCQCNTMVKYII